MTLTSQTCCTFSCILTHLNCSFDKCITIRLKKNYSCYQLCGSLEFLSFFFFIKHFFSIDNQLWEKKLIKWFQKEFKIKAFIWKQRTVLQSDLIEEKTLQECMLPTSMSLFCLKALRKYSNPTSTYLRSQELKAITNVTVVAKALTLLKAWLQTFFKAWAL